MDQKKGPISREKKVSEGSAHVGRRQEQPSSAPSGGGQPQSGGTTRSGGGSSLIRLIVLAAVVLLGGGGGLSALLGGGLGGSSDLGDLTGGLAGGTPTQSVTSSDVQSGKLDTTVSKQAREKRTVILGGGKDTVTVMVYMCGTDLESGGGYATKDLQEMTQAALSEKVNLLVYTGGCKKWSNSVVSSGKNQIFKIQDGGLLPLWENTSLQPMTDPDTLAEYIQWAKKNYPADRYELIFWDHGGGSVSGYGYDEVYPRSGSMTLGGISTALKKGGVTFDFIGFDACLMATLETALVAEPYADYLIASEETEPGCGWYYTGWLTALSKDTSMATLDVGKAIADDFVQTCAQVAARQQATLSVIDLAELSGTVPESFKRFAEATSASIKAEDYQSIATARGNTKEFAESNHIDQVDLIDLADNMGTAESKALAKVLRSAVKYNATSSNISNANGVSIYFPYGRTSNVNKASQLYDEIGLDSSYTDCIKSFASLEVAGQSVAGGSSAQLESLFGALMGGGSSSSSGGSLGSAAVEQLLGALLTGGRSLTEVGLTGEEAGFLDGELLERSSAYLAEHRFDPGCLVWTDKGGVQVISMSEDQWELVQDVELNVFVDDGEGYIDLGLDNVFQRDEDGDLIGTYDRTWLAVNGQIVAYYMLSSDGTQEDYKIMGRIPALLNGRQVDLMVCFTDEQPDGEILGAAVCYDEQSETATVARGLTELQEGDAIDFLCDYYDYDRQFQSNYFLGDRLTVSGELTLSNIRMDNADYIAAYRVTDIYQNHYWTPPVK